MTEQTAKNSRNSSQKSTLLKRVQNKKSNRQLMDAIDKLSDQLSEGSNWSDNSIEYLYDKFEDDKKALKRKAVRASNTI